jgi:hypothetical protein
MLAAFESTPRRHHVVEFEDFLLGKAERQAQLAEVALGTRRLQGGDCQGYDVLI